MFEKFKNRKGTLKRVKGVKELRSEKRAYQRKSLEAAQEAVFTPSGRTYSPTVDQLENYDA